MTKNIIEKELLELREYSEKNEEKQKKFWSDKKLLNKKTGELEDVSFNLRKAYKQSYDDIVSKSIYFRKEMEEKYQDNFTCLFVTITTNSKWHKYKKNFKNDNLIPNPRYNKKKYYTRFLCAFK